MNSKPASKLASLVKQYGFNVTLDVIKSVDEVREKLAAKGAKPIACYIWLRNREAARSAGEGVSVETAVVSENRPARDKYNDERSSCSTQL